MVMLGEGESALFWTALAACQKRDADNNNKADGLLLLLPPPPPVRPRTVAAAADDDGGDGKDTRDGQGVMHSAGRTQ